MEMPDAEESLPSSPEHRAPRRRDGPPSLAEQLISRDNQAWLFRLGLMALIAGVGLFADKHFDGRYVRLEVYHADVEAAHREAALERQAYLRAVDEQRESSKMLTEMHNDIQWLREALQPLRK